MPYWCAQLEPQRERLALHVLAIIGYEPYLPRVREHRIVRQQKVGCGAAGMLPTSAQECAR